MTKSRIRLYAAFCDNDCPLEIRHEHALGRDAYLESLEERLRKYKKYWIAEDYYMDTEKPMKQAHYVLR